MSPPERPAPAPVPPKADHEHPGRREFVRTAGALLAAGTALGLRSTPARAGSGGRVTGGSGGSPAWARLEPVGDGIWAVVSTPLADAPEARRTLANGGIIAGRDGLLVVEAFATPEGAAWVAEESLRLTGMRPTHVVLTHYHGDHVTGAVGYAAAGARPEILATRTTRRLLAEQEAALPEDRTAARPLLLPDVVLPAAGPVTELDLGGRTVGLRPRRGHTPSDLVVEADDVVFAGDLVWNGMFPNYMDAIPSELARHVRALRDQSARLYVSGHGEPADPANLERYVGLLDAVETSARHAIEDGRPLDEAGAAFRVPASLGSWHMFSPRYPEVAFRAWARELGG